MCALLLRQDDFIRSEAFVLISIFSKTEDWPTSREQLFHPVLILLVSEKLQAHLSELLIHALFVVEALCRASVYL